jgi:hypothetical protein
LLVDAANDTLKAIAASLSIFCLLVVTPIVTLYLLNDWDGLIATIDRSVPMAQRETVRTLSREIDDTLAGFLRGQGTICLSAEGRRLSDRLSAQPSLHCRGMCSRGQFAAERSIFSFLRGKKRWHNQHRL